MLIVKKINVLDKGIKLDGNPYRDCIELTISNTKTGESFIKKASEVKPFEYIGLYESKIIAYPKYDADSLKYIESVQCIQEDLNSSLDMYEINWLNQVHFLDEQGTCIAFDLVGTEVVLTIFQFLAMLYVIAGTPSTNTFQIFNRYHYGNIKITVSDKFAMRIAKYLMLKRNFPIPNSTLLLAAKKAGMDKIAILHRGGSVDVASV